MDEDTGKRIGRDAQEKAIETYLPGIQVTEEDSNNKNLFFICFIIFYTL